MYGKNKHSRQIRGLFISKLDLAPGKQGAVSGHG